VSLAGELAEVEAPGVEHTRGKGAGRLVTTEKGCGCPPWLLGSQARQGFALGAARARTQKMRCTLGAWGRGARRETHGEGLTAWGQGGVPACCTWR
jgi:hypothetical protein